MRALKLKKEQYLRRRKRSKKAFPNKDEMRLCIFKSTNHIEAQIIDDFNQKTIISRCDSSFDNITNSWL